MIRISSFMWQTYMFNLSDEDYIQTVCMGQLWQKWRQAEGAHLVDSPEELYIQGMCDQNFVKAYVYRYLKKEDLDKVIPIKSTTNLSGNFFAFQQYEAMKWNLYELHA